MHPGVESGIKMAHSCHSATLYITLSVFLSHCLLLIKENIVPVVSTIVLDSVC